MIKRINFYSSTVYNSKSGSQTVSEWTFWSFQFSSRTDIQHWNAVVALFKVTQTPENWESKTAVA